MGNYDECVVIITGGAGGIGKVTAKEYLQKGAKVYLLGRTLEKLEASREELREISETVFVLQRDITKEYDCENMISQIAKREKYIDILINSAGIYLEKATLDCSIKEWDNVINTNLKGTFLMCKQVLPYLIKSKGAIINVSSDAGLVGFNGVAAYCASKGGINMLTKSLAVEFAEHGVRINAVCPDMVDTEMLQKDFESSDFQSREEYDQYNWKVFSQGGKQGRYIQPEEVAKAIVFLGSPEMAAITGTCLTMDFGLTAGF